MLRGPDVPRAEAKHRFDQRNARQDAPRNIGPAKIPSNSDLDRGRGTLLQRAAGERVGRLEMHIDADVIRRRVDDGRISIGEQAGFRIENREDHIAVPPAPPGEDPPKPPMLRALEYDDRGVSPLHRSNPNRKAQARTDPMTNPTVRKIGRVIFHRSKARSLIWYRSTLRCVLICRLRISSSHFFDDVKRRFYTNVVSIYGCGCGGSRLAGDWLCRGCTHILYLQRVSNAV